MLTRRSLLPLAAASLAAGATPWRAFAQATLPPQQAQEFVQRISGELAAVVNGPGTLPQKQQRLRPIIDGAVDVEGVGRFCLGRFWRVATPEQQHEYLNLFHSVLMNSITGKLGEYQGVKVTVTRAEKREDGDYVYSTVTRPNSEPNSVIWVIAAVGGQPKIVDVIAEGTSLRLTQRSDYASYLVHNNNSVQALINAMRRQVEQG